MPGPESVTPHDDDADSLVDSEDDSALVHTAETHNILRLNDINVAHICKKPKDAKVCDFQCKCKLNNGLPCISLFSTEMVIDQRRSMTVITKFEKDLILLGMISCGMNNSDMTECSRRSTQTERQLQRTNYYSNGFQVCRDTFKFLNTISQSKLTGLLKWYKENGLTPRRKMSGRGGRAAVQVTRKRVATQGCIRGGKRGRGGTQ